jgi:hypothetical protein
LTGEFEKELQYGAILERVKAKGFSEENLIKCIEDNEANDIWVRTAGGNKLKWLMIDEKDVNKILILTVDAGALFFYELTARLTRSNLKAFNFHVTRCKCKTQTKIKRFG